jgi:hypothetical protein
MIVMLGVAFGLVHQVLAADAPLYQNDFSKSEVDKVPEDLLVLDGNFAVKEEAGNRFLELPGAPLETYGVLFGPSQADGVQVTARIFSTKQGRKFSTFGAGLNGVGGFKVRVAPAKDAVELVRGDDIRTSAPFKWKSGEWTSLKLQVRKDGDGFKIEAKVWQGDAEPKDWTITAEIAEALPAGKAGVWGMPFAGTPIRFDDLTVRKTE